MTQPNVPELFSLEYYIDRLRQFTTNSAMHSAALGQICGVLNDAAISDTERLRQIRNIREAVDLVEPELDARPGLDYSRADGLPDDPTPVSPARVPLHTGAVTDEGLVDETPAEPVTVFFSFGHGQTDPGTGKNLLDHYVTIIGPSYAACWEAMFASRFGDRWAFDYIAGSPQAVEWIPRWTEHERIVLPVAEPVSGSR